MSDYEDEFDDDENDGADASKLVKDLRKQLRAQKKALEEASTELSTFRAEQRKSSVAELLKKAGADAGYSEFYTSEDTSEEAVNAWIQSKSTLLGIKEAEKDDPEAEQVNRLTDALNSAPKVKMGSTAEVLDKIRSAKTREEFEASIGSVFKATA